MVEERRGGGAARGVELVVEEHCGQHRRERHHSNGYKRVPENPRFQEQRRAVYGD